MLLKAHWLLMSGGDGFTHRNRSDSEEERDRDEDGEPNEAPAKHRQSLPWREIAGGISVEKQRKRSTPDAPGVDRFHIGGLDGTRTRDLWIDSPVC